MRSLTLSRRLFFVAAVLAGLCYGGYMLSTGVRMSSDSFRYSRWADALVAAQFDYNAYLNSQQFAVPPVLYVLWVSIVAAAKELLGEHWAAGLVTLNWISAVGLVYALARVTAFLAGSVGLGVIAAMTFTSSIDVLLFMPYVLSDVIFTAVSGAILLLGLTITTGGPGNWRPLLGGTVLVLIASIFRPTTAPLVVFWAGCAVVAFWRGITRARALAGLGILLVSVMVGILAHAAIMQDPSRVAAAARSGWVQQLSKDANDGIVVSDRPETYVSAPRTFGDFVMLTLTKWAYYFAPWLSAYSGVHKLTSGAFFVSLYSLSLIAVVCSVRWRIAWLIALFIGAFSLFHGMQQIDYDHRYRLPIIPALSVLAVLGLERVAQRHPWSH